MNVLKIQKRKLNVIEEEYKYIINKSKRLESELYKRTELNAEKDILSNKNNVTFKEFSNLFNEKLLFYSYINNENGLNILSAIYNIFVKNNNKELSENLLEKESNLDYRKKIYLLVEDMTLNELENFLDKSFNEINIFKELNSGDIKIPEFRYEKTITYKDKNDLNCIFYKKKDRLSNLIKLHNLGATQLNIDKINIENFYKTDDYSKLDYEFFHWYYDTIYIEENFKKDSESDIFQPFQEINEMRYFYNDELFLKLKDDIFNRTLYSVAIDGTSSCGKTTLINNFYSDKISNYSDCTKTYNINPTSSHSYLYLYSEMIKTSKYLVLDRSPISNLAYQICYYLMDRLGKNKNILDAITFTGLCKEYIKMHNLKSTLEFINSNNFNIIIIIDSNLEKISERMCKRGEATDSLSDINRSVFKNYILCQNAAYSYLANELNYMCVDINYFRIKYEIVDENLLFDMIQSNLKQFILNFFNYMYYSDKYNTNNFNEQEIYKNKLNKDLFLKRNKSNYNDIDEIIEETFNNKSKDTRDSSIIEYPKISYKQSFMNKNHMIKNYLYSYIISKR